MARMFRPKVSAGQFRLGDEMGRNAEMILVAQKFRSAIPTHNDENRSPLRALLSQGPGEAPYFLGAECNSKITVLLTHNEFAT